MVACPVRGDGASPVVETFTQRICGMHSAYRSLSMRWPFQPPSTKYFMSKKNVVCAHRGHGNWPVVFGLCQNGGVPATTALVLSPLLPTALSPMRFGALPPSVVRNDFDF